MNQLSPGQFDLLDGSIRAATDAILAQQRPDGHWVYELEADCTIPAEYVLLVHYLAEAPNLELEKKIGVYPRRIWCAPAKYFVPAAAPSRPTSSPASCWRCMAKPPGPMCPPCLWN